MTGIDVSKVATGIDNVKEQNCPLCNINKNILCHGDSFYVMSPKGSLASGHCFIVPHFHLDCYGRLQDSFVDELLETKIRLRNILAKEYHTDKIIIFEHGHIGNAQKPTEYCKHAHLHFVPIEFNGDFVVFIEKNLKIKPIEFSSFRHFKSYVKSENMNEEYLYIDDGGSISAFFLTSIQLPRHYFRYCYLKLGNKSLEHADWMKHPNWGTVEDTVKKLVDKF